MDRDARCTMPVMAGRKEEGKEETVRVEVEATGPFGALEPYGPGHALWRRFTVKIDRFPVWPILVLDFSVSDGRASIEAVRFQRREGERGLSASSIRVPLGEVFQFAIDSAVMDVEEVSPGHYKISPPPQGRKGERSLAAAAIYTRKQTPGARRGWSPEEAMTALTLYRQAKDEGQKDPFGWVGDQLQRSRTTAHRMVKNAEIQEEGERGRSR